MKKLLISMVLLLPIFSFGQQIDSIVTTTYGHFKIKESEFTFQKIRTDEGYYNDKFDTSDSNIQFILLKNNDTLLTYILRGSDADCDSYSLELGDYDLTDSSIILYSYYAWVGGCCGLPYGVREQIYKVNEKGELYLDKSEIYLEDYKTAVSDMDSEKRKEWISQTEENYTAKFVLGKKAVQLMEAVKRRLAKRIMIETKGWETDPHGYRR